jgi:uncharacterized protein YndB with AHSA1/START domain
VSPSLEARSAPSILGKLWPLLAGAATGLALRLVFWGDANEAFDVMMASFTLLVPVAVGAVTVYTAERTRRRSWASYFWSAAAANALFVVGAFIILIEGIICTIIAVPLFSLIGGCAGLLTGAICRWRGRPTPTVLSVTVFPLIFGAVEQHLPLPNRIDSVTVSRLIEASPDAVWQAIMHADAIRPEEIGSAWMYRIGVPLPLLAITESVDGERVRHIEMGKGIRFDQLVVDWEPAQLVRWTYRFTGDSFPPWALDEHVRIGGPYFDLEDTSYELHRVEDGTLVTAQMRYRVSTHFNWYARLVARFLVGDFEATALAFYAQRAESAVALP